GYARSSSQGNEDRWSLIGEGHVPGRGLQGRKDVLLVVRAWRRPLVDMERLSRVQGQQREDEGQHDAPREMPRSIRKRRRHGHLASVPDPPKRSRASIPDVKACPLDQWR